MHGVDKLKTGNQATGRGGAQAGYSAGEHAGDKPVSIQEQEV